jgi:16S rRNA processing protein RimM
MSRNTDRLDRELQDDLVLIGEVVKPHGIRGEIKVYLFSEKPGNFKQYKEIFLQEPTGRGTEAFTVVKSREHGKLAILQLESVGTIEAAEDLKGRNIWVNKTDFPALGSGEYYWQQLNGLMVVTEAGQEIGRVSKLFNTTAHDIMVVTGAGHEFMIPVKGEIIKDIDEQGGKIVISPPPGLLEINK